MSAGTSQVRYFSTSSVTVFQLHAHYTLDLYGMFSLVDNMHVTYSFGNLRRFPHPNFVERYRLDTQSSGPPNCKFSVARPGPYVISLPLACWKNNATRNSFGGVRVTAEQRELMLAYMIKHPTLASGRMQTPQGGRLKKMMWEELAKILNACPRGSQKSADRWCKSWQDWRLDAKQKACRLQMNISRTGEDPGGTTAPLTSIEEKLIAFLEGKTVCIDEGLMDSLEAQTMERFSPVSIQLQDANENNKTSFEEERVNEEEPDRTMSQEENFVETHKIRSPIRKVQSSHSQFTNQLPFIRRAFNRLEKISNTSKGETEFEIFGRSIAAQLSQIPLVDALELQLKIQSLITQERLRIIKENS